MRRLDQHPDVIFWQSEELAIPYMNPVKGKTSRYFPDFVVKKRIGDNKYQMIMIEVKPKKQAAPPNTARKTPSGRVSRKYLNEAATYEINKAKWKAAERYCKERGWLWQIMTEDEIRPLGK